MFCRRGNKILIVTEDVLYERRVDLVFLGDGEDEEREEEGRRRGGGLCQEWHRRTAPQHSSNYRTVCRSPSRVLGEGREHRCPFLTVLSFVGGGRLF